MTDDAAFGWVEPSQARSKQKVDRILNAAIELGIEKGSLDIKFTEVAKRAGVAIGTLYQFFPNRSALIGRLFAREMEPIDQATANALVDFGSIEALSENIETALRETLELVRRKPGLMVIWSSPALDPVIESADFANTRRNARVLSDRLKSLLPDGSELHDIRATALIICHLWGSVVRLSVLAGEEHEPAILKQYANMLAAHGRALASR